MAPEEHRLAERAFAYDKGSYTAGSVDFVSRQAKAGHTKLREIDRHFADRLHGIAMKPAAIRNHARMCRDILNAARFTVRQL